MDCVEDAFEAKTMHGRRRVWACRGRAGELRDFFQHHVRKIAAGYCEALPILVQQRPYADMKFAVRAQFS